MTGSTSQIRKIRGGRRSPCKGLNYGRAEVIESGVTQVWYDGTHLYVRVQGCSARDEPPEITETNVQRAQEASTCLEFLGPGQPGTSGRGCGHDYNYVLGGNLGKTASIYHVSTITRP